MRAPRLCVTSSARTVEGARAAVEAAASDGADVVEIRFDRWSPTEQERVAELFPSRLPLLGTYRSVAEGGEGSVDRSVRARVLARLRSLPFELVDRELARDPAPARGRGSRSLASRHLSAPVEWPALRSLVDRRAATGERRKVVAPATVGEFLGPFREIRREADPTDTIVLAVGPAGPLSRVWPSWLATEWVFASPGPQDPIAETPVEPSQVPVDRLRSVLRRDPPGPLFGVVGHPVAFSESPTLHHDWFRADGYDGAYVALDVETEREFRDLLDVLGPGGFRGVNVTHPWKGLARTVAHHAETPSLEADAANCLTWDGSEWSAALTDVDALDRRFTELRSSGRWDGAELLIVGAGAAARAAVLAARRQGIRAGVRARRPEAVERVRERFPETVVLPDRGPATLLVHATPYGRDPLVPLGVPLDDLLGAGTHVLDLVYGRSPSPLRAMAESAGASYEDGRRVLRYQAEESYRRWWGHRPPGGADA